MTAVQIVGLCGVARAGKTSTANFMKVDKGFTNIRFTDSMAKICLAAGLTPDHVDGRLKDTPEPLLGGATPRQFMVGIGRTLRAFNPEFFPEHWRRQVRAITPTLHPMLRKIVADDVRTPAEAAAIKAEDGVLIRIIPTYPAYANATRGIDYDPATEDQQFDVDHTVRNAGSAFELAGQVYAILAATWPRPLG
jgi:hypothetical protein